jgi:LEA14-like dessication related protein
MTVGETYVFFLDKSHIENRTSNDEYLPDMGGLGMFPVRGDKVYPRYESWIPSVSGMTVENLVSRLETYLGHPVEETFNSLTPSITDTSLGYNLNHTVQLILNTTLANSGPLDVSFRGLSFTILVGGKQVRLTKLGNLTLMAGRSLSLDDSKLALNVTDLDESLYRALKSPNLTLEVDFNGVAEAGGVTRNVTLRGNSTTGFLHGPGEGPIGPADMPLMGPLNSIDIPHVSQRYMSLVGIFTSARISTSLIYAGSVYNQTIDALAFEVTDTGPPWTFIIIAENTHMPLAYNSTDYSDLRSLGMVYASGSTFNYQGWNGEEYHILIPTEVSSSPIIDFVGEARSYIISRVGEVNYDRSFLYPLVTKNMDNDQEVVTSYSVSYDYPIWVGYEFSFFPVSVYLSTNGTITGSYGIPNLNNLAPYRIDTIEARKLALDAGLTRGSYPLDISMVYWHSVNGTTPVWGDRYLWEVRSWIDPPESNPRMLNYALIDPSTGEVYKIGKFGIGSIGTAVFIP